jgi:hypothetical protein
MTSEKGECQRFCDNSASASVTRNCQCEKGCKKWSKIILFVKGSASNKVNKIASSPKVGTFELV